MSSAKEPNPLGKRGGRLRRLQQEAYQGHVIVHWTMTLQDRAQGWLETGFHSRLREAMFHVAARYHLIWPGYCLMPDHGHFLVMGVSEHSDQKSAMRMFRREWNRLLGNGQQLDRQSYDHVLRTEEREREAFSNIAVYIFDNPVRAGLVQAREEWSYAGTIVPGYPSLDWRAENFWNSFWLAHEAVAR